MSDENKTYLGDGLYVHDDGWQLWLTAERDGMTHAVALEPEVFMDLLKYVERTKGLSIIVQPAKKEPITND